MRLTTAEDRTKLAEFMGTSVHYVNSMLYRGEGGLDAWISALLYCLHIKPDELIQVFQKKVSKLNTHPEPNESDEIWRGLDRLIKPGKKLWWSKVLQAAVKESLRISRDSERS